MRAPKEDVLVAENCNRRAGVGSGYTRTHLRTELLDLRQRHCASEACDKGRRRQISSTQSRTPLLPAQACVCACMLNTCTIYATAHKDPPDVLVAAACVPIVVDDGHREHAHLIPTFSQAQFAVSVHIKNPPFQHPLSHAKLCMKVVWFH